MALQWRCTCSDRSLISLPIVFHRSAQRRTQVPDLFPPIIVAGCRASPARMTTQRVEFWFTKVSHESTFPSRSKKEHENDFSSSTTLVDDIDQHQSQLKMFHVFHNHKLSSRKPFQYWTKTKIVTICSNIEQDQQSFAELCTSRNRSLASNINNVQDLIKDMSC